MNENMHIVVIGASAGGLTAIAELLGKISTPVNAAFFVVLHISKDSVAEVILDVFRKKTSLLCRVPKSGEAIEAGVVYLAPADQHLIIKKGKVLVTRGAKENLWRPSIDVLFRSAAAAYSTRVTGIILTGMLDDGTSGMIAIKKSGGICIVQDPAEARFNAMPNSVLEHVKVDYQVRIAEIPLVLKDLFTRDVEERPIPEEIEKEALITEKMASAIDLLPEIGTHSNYTCPDCGGGLWEIKEEHGFRFRCHTGHVYTQNLLEQRQKEVLEQSLWVGIRMMEERRNLLLHLIEAHADGEKKDEERKQKVEELQLHIERLKVIILGL